MAKMIRLHDPVLVEIGNDITVVASSAGLFSDGTRADVHLYNGEIQGALLVYLSIEKSRAEVSERFAEIAGVDAAVIASALLNIKDQAEGVLRKEEEATAQIAGPANEPTTAMDDVEPWDDPVDGEELVAALKGVIERFLALPKGASHTVSLWILLTYLLDVVEVLPILMISSPQPRCGKSTLMAILLATCRSALTASNISTAAVYRSIEKWQPTLLVDEADSFLRQNEELRGIINSGHTRATAHVIRCAPDTHEPEVFSTWGPKAIAGIGRQPTTIQDRSIEIPMRRRLPNEKVERFRMARIGEFAYLMRQCRRWADDHADEVRESDPDVPDYLNDRAADNWRTLLQIANTIGGKCTEETLKELEALVGGTSEADEDASVMLLLSMKSLFDKSKTGRILSDDLVNALHDTEDAPWGEWGKALKPITKRQVAGLLKPFGIRPKTVRDNEKNGKGYCVEDCQDAFFRYIPPTPSVTPSQASAGAEIRENLSVTTPPNVTDRKTRIPSTGVDCDGVTDGKDGYLEKSDDGRISEDF